MPAAAVPPLAAPPPDSDPVEVQVTYEGLSQHYQYFFRDKAGRASLRDALGPTLRAPAVDVRVRFDTARMRGTVDLVAPRGEPAARAVATHLRDTGVLDPAPLLPWLTAAAAFRDQVGRQFDMRIYSFRAGVAVPLGDGTECRFTEPREGPPDPTFGAVVECGGTVQDPQQIRPGSGERWPARAVGSREGLVARLAGALAAPAGPAQGTNPSPALPPVAP